MLCEIAPNAETCSMSFVCRLIVCNMFLIFSLICGQIDSFDYENIRVG